MSDSTEREPLLGTGPYREVEQADRLKPPETAFHDPVDGAAFHVGEDGEQNLYVEVFSYC